MSNPRISFVVPAYNAATTLSETLDALILQSCPDWECVIVDDGSSDDTLRIAERYAARDDRFRVISQENRGSGGAYNTGVRNVASPIVCICSSDDILLPSHVAGILCAFDGHPDIDIVSTNGFYLTPSGTREIVYSGRGSTSSSKWSLSEVIARCFFSVGASYRKEWYDRCGGYREDVYGEDWDFWLRAMATGARHLYLPQETAIQRVSEKQKTADLSSVFRSNRAILEHLRQHYTLSEDEGYEVDQAIAEANRLLERNERGANRSEKTVLVTGKRWLRSLLNRIFGESRTHRWLRARHAKRHD